MNGRHDIRPPLTLALTTNNPDKLREAEAIIRRLSPDTRLLGWTPKQPVEENGFSFAENARIKVQAAVVEKQAALDFLAHFGPDPQALSSHPAGRMGLDLADVSLLSEIDMLIGEDSGLVVDCLSPHQDFPGIYSNRWLNRDIMERLGLPPGETISAEDRNRAMLRLLEGIPADRRTARYIAACSAADFQGGDMPLYSDAQGAVQLVIAEEIKGSYGFAYDAIAKFALEECVQGRLPFLSPAALEEIAACTIAEIADPAVKQAISHRARALTALLSDLLKI